MESPIEWTEIGAAASSKKRRRESKADAAVRVDAHRAHLAVMLAHELRCHERCCDEGLQAFAVARVPAPVYLASRCVLRFACAPPRCAAPPQRPPDAF